MNAALFLLEHLVVIGLIASTVLAGGLPWVRRVSMAEAERVAVAAALGLAVAGHVALGLGLVGLLRPLPVLALVLAAHLLAWPDLRDLLSHAGRAWRAGRAGPRRLAMAAGVIGLLPPVLCALYPPTAFDETLYHLPYAQAFARTGSLPFLPDLRFPVFPQLMEAVFAVVLLLAGDVASHGVSLVAMLAVALLVAVWARREAGALEARGAPGLAAAAGGIAAAFLLGQPVAVHLAGSAYVEPALALFAAGAFYGADRWRVAGDRRWLLLAAALGGTAASTKYLGVLVLAGISIQVAVVAARRGAGRELAAYGAVVAATLAVTYGRLLYHTGNPVFPFFPEVFGSTAWDATAFLGPRGARRWAALPTLPWDVVFARGAVGGLPPFHPLLPLALPLLLFGAWRNRRVREWLLWAGGFVLLAPIGAHYLWTVMPLAALAFGVSCAELLEAMSRARGAPGRGGAAWRAPAAWIFLACLAPGWLYGAYRLVRLGPMPVEVATRRAFLAARLPLFPAVDFVNGRCGQTCTVYAVHAEHMVYFAGGRFLGDWNGPASFARTLPAGPDPRALRGNLLRLGVQYLLVPVEARRAIGLAGDAPGFRRVYSDRAADVYEVASSAASRRSRSIVSTMRSSVNPVSTVRRASRQIAS